MNSQEIPAGAPCWIDLMTSDIAKSRDFYAALFGWSYEVGDQEMYGGYTMAFKDGKSVAGLMQSQENGEGYPDMWTTYLRVDDIEATMAAAKNAGAIAYMEPMNVPEQGKWPCSATLAAPQSGCGSSAATPDSNRTRRTAPPHGMSSTARITRLL
ncbi:VOC family protein [Arthrobacter alpinus]|nr:VOC family protein [Arthrobacter alpinus]